MKEYKKIERPRYPGYPNHSHGSFEEAIALVQLYKDAATEQGMSMSELIKTLSSFRRSKRNPPHPSQI